MLEGPSNILDAPASPLALDSSPEDSIYELINGEAPGFFTPVGWSRKLQTAPGQVQGPIVVRVEITDPMDGRDDDQIALIWDGEVVAGLSSAPQGSVSLFHVDDVAGEVLEVWAQGQSMLGFGYATDAGYKVSIHSAAEAPVLEAEAAETNAARASTKVDPLERIVGSANNLSAALIVGVVVIGGLYLLKK